MGRVVEKGLVIRETDDWGLDGCSPETVRSYDEAGYLRRQATAAMDWPTDEGGSYRGSLLFTPLPVRSKGVSVPVVLSMAARYIYSQLCDASSDLIKKWIPYRYMRGANHGRVEGRYRRWDMLLCAGGQEGVVEELRARVWGYERQRLDILLTRWDMESRSCVYAIEGPGARATLHVVFSDKEALRRVRLRCFAQDCGALVRSSCELEKAVRKEKDLLACYIERQLSDIRARYVNVIPMRRRYSVIA